MENVKVNFENEEPNSEPMCEIHFENNPNRVYYTGQVVAGCVYLVINEETAVRGIYANIIGRGYCAWRISSGHNRTVTNAREEFYMNRKIYYIGSENNISGRIIVQPGEYKYLFECNIPEEFHTSVEEDTGFIRYSLTVVIEEDEEKKKEFIESFTVINPLNLNDDVSYNFPMSDEAEFTFTKYCCCLCCWITEPVKFTVKVPRKGYAPGEAIEITINVDNKSNQTYDNFIGNIFKKIEFFANERTSTFSEKLTTANCEGCLPGEELSRKLIVTVPPTPRTETSNICSISYTLTVEAIADLCREDLSLEFPLTVGSYPIVNTNTETGNIIVTQQPTKGVQNEQGLDVEISNKSSNDSNQMEPLLLKGNASSQKTTKERKDNTIASPEFRVAESTRSDKVLQKSYRPLYPMYTANPYPLNCTLKVESGEVKPVDG